MHDLRIQIYKYYFDINLIMFTNLVDKANISILRSSLYIRHSTEVSTSNTVQPILQYRLELANPSHPHGLVKGKFILLIRKKQYLFISVRQTFSLG